jgi:hypothetical protein
LNHYLTDEIDEVHFKTFKQIDQMLKFACPVKKITSCFASERLFLIHSESAMHEKEVWEDIVARAVFYEHNTNPKLTLCFKS